MNKLSATIRHVGFGLVASTALALLINPAAASDAAQDKTATPYAPSHVAMQVQRVPDSDVYYVIGQPAVPGQDNEGFTSNAGFVVTSDGVVVYDTLGTPSLGYALLKKIREVTDQPVKYVIAGHYHADHIYGLQVFKDHTDAIIIGQEKASEYFHGSQAGLQQGPAQIRLQQRREALAPWVDDNTRVVKPDVTFKQHMDIRLGDTRLSLSYVGPAHSPSDVMMMVHPANVLFAGDIMQNKRIPVMFGPEVDTGNWLKGLDKVLEMQPRFVIGGHGTPTDDPTAAVKFTHDYIEYLQTTMSEAVDNWVDFEQAYAQTDWSQYEDLPAFEEANKKNAYRAYLNMEQQQFD